MQGFDIIFSNRLCDDDAVKYSHHVPREFLVHLSLIFDHHACHNRDYSTHFSYLEHCVTDLLRDCPPEPKKPKKSKGFGK